MDSEGQERLSIKLGLKLDQHQAESGPEPLVTLDHCRLWPKLDMEMKSVQ